MIVCNCECRYLNRLYKAKLTWQENAIASGWVFLCNDDAAWGILFLNMSSNQLAPAFTGIFNTSCSYAGSPVCSKVSSIMPIPKKDKLTGLKDYRPHALTSWWVIMMMIFWVADTGPPEVHYKFHYQKSITGPLSLSQEHSEHVPLPHPTSLGLSSHLCKDLVCGILLCLQPCCSWASPQLRNTTHPAEHTLLHLSMDHPFSDEVEVGPPHFRLHDNEHRSTTGLFSHHSCTPFTPMATPQQRADSTAVGLISNDKTTYRSEVGHLTAWCVHDNLGINAAKTAEMLFDLHCASIPLPVDHWQSMAQLCPRLSLSDSSGPPSPTHWNGPTI